MSDLRVIEARGATAAEWDTAWTACAYATYFHSRHWTELFAGVSSQRYQPRPMHVGFSDGAAAVVVMMGRRSRWLPLWVMESAAGGTYGGWISGDRLGPAHAGLLIDVMRRSGARVRWRINPYDAVVDALALPVDLRDTTNTIRITGAFSDHFKTWSKGHRAAISQAQRAGVSVREAVAEDDWRAYFAVYRDTLRRWGARASTSYPWEFFDALRRRPGVRLWLADCEGGVVAGAVCLYAPTHVAYWHGAARESHFDRRPVNLLIHDAIKNAFEGGYAWFDFNPSGGHDGVRSFKKSFGTEERRADVVTYASGLWPALRTVQQRIRGVRR